MLHILPGSLRRIGLVLGALAILSLATGWVPGAPLGPSIAAAMHEGTEPTMTGDLQVLLVVLPVVWVFSPMIVATMFVSCILAGVLWTTRGHAA